MVAMRLYELLRFLRLDRLTLLYNYIHMMRRSKQPIMQPMSVAIKDTGIA